MQSSYYNILWGMSCRNAALAAAGMKAPTPVKTGTTIAGLVFKVSLIRMLLARLDHVTCCNRMELFWERILGLLR